MKKGALFLLVPLMVLVLSGCDDNSARQVDDSIESDLNDSEEIIIIEADSVLPSGEPELEASPEPVNGPRVEVTAGDNGEAIRWIVYDHIQWDDYFNGLVTSIERVAVTNQMVSIEDPEDYSRAVVHVSFTVENTSGQIFTTYPDLAVLVTSAGEQIDIPDLWITDHLGGEIQIGERKEGTVTWYLNSEDAESLDWIILKWYAFEGGEMDHEARLQKDYEVKLNLK
jgi:hypothetical protein